MKHNQPRLKAFDMEYFGEAKTISGSIWWYEEKLKDGTVRRVPLQPVEPKTEK